MANGQWIALVGATVVGTLTSVGSVIMIGDRLWAARDTQAGMTEEIKAVRQSQDRTENQLQEVLRRLREIEREKR